MDHQILETVLRKTFEDRKISLEERHQLRYIVTRHKYDYETLAFIRNRAFRIAAEVVDGNESREILKWLEEVVRIIDQTLIKACPAVVDVAFSPGNECLDKVITTLTEAKRSADICMFTITDNRIRDAIVALHRRGRRVRIISDDEKMKDPGSDISYLSQQGIPVAVDDSKEHMHHKFAVFDRGILLTGSFNWTRSAVERNHENILVTDNERLVGPFLKEFERLWESFRVIE